MTKRYISVVRNDREAVCDMENWLVEKYGFRNKWDSFYANGSKTVVQFEFVDERTKFLFDLKWSDRITIHETLEPALTEVASRSTSALRDSLRLKRKREQEQN